MGARTEQRTLVIHVGQMKSGTTTLQNGLAKSRSDLLSAGVLYPDQGQNNHMLSMAALMTRDELAMSRMPCSVRTHVEHIARRISPLWPDLQDQVEGSSASRVVLSAENLVYAGPRTRAALLEAFPSRRISIVITMRRLPELLPSMYQQLAKIEVIPGFEDWTRLALGDLGRPEAVSSVWWFLAHRMELAWAGDFRQVDTFDMSRAVIQVALPQAWEALTGVRAPNLGGPPANATLSAGVVIGIQRFLSAHRALSISTIRRLEERAFRHETWPVDVGLGGRFSLKSWAAGVLDGVHRLGDSQADQPDGLNVLASLAKAREPLTTVKTSTDGGEQNVVDMAVRTVTALGKARYSVYPRLLAGRVQHGK